MNTFNIAFCMPQVPFEFESERSNGHHFIIISDYILLQMFGTAYDQLVSYSFCIIVGSSILDASSKYDLYLIRELHILDIVIFFLL